MQSAERFANGIFYKSSIKHGKWGEIPRNRNQIRTSTTTSIYAKSKKRRSPTLGSGKPADLDDRKGARKVPATAIISQPIAPPIY